MAVDLAMVLIGWDELGFLLAIGWAWVLIGYQVGSGFDWLPFGHGC